MSILSLIIFTGISLCRQSFLLSRLWISAKSFFFVSKLNENCRSLPPMNVWFFYTRIIFVLFNSIKNKISNVWACYIVLAITLSISKFSTRLLKSLLESSPNFSLLLIALLLLFKIIDSFWKAFSEKTRLAVSQIFLLLENSMV